jgi:hypothetical protein
MSFIRGHREPERGRRQLDAPDRREIRTIGVLLEDAIEYGVRCGNALVDVDGRAVLRHPFADHAQFFPPDGIQQQLRAQRQFAIRRQHAGRENPGQVQRLQVCAHVCRAADLQCLGGSVVHGSSHGERLLPQIEADRNFHRGDLQLCVPIERGHPQVQPVGESALQIARQRVRIHQCVDAHADFAAGLGDRQGRRNARHAPQADEQGEGALHLFTSTEPIRYRSM